MRLEQKEEKTVPPSARCSVHSPLSSPLSPVASLSFRCLQPLLRLPPARNRLVRDSLRHSSSPDSLAAVVPAISCCVVVVSLPAAVTSLVAFSAGFAFGWLLSRLTPLATLVGSSPVLVSFVTFSAVPPLLSRKNRFNERNPHDWHGQRVSTPCHRRPKKKRHQSGKKKTSKWHHHEKQTPFFEKQTPFFEKQTPQKKSDTAKKKKRHRKKKSDTAKKKATPQKKKRHRFLRWVRRTHLPKNRFKTNYNGNVMWKVRQTANNYRICHHYDINLTVQWNILHTTFRRSIEKKRNIVLRLRIKEWMSYVIELPLNRKSLIACSDFSKKEQVITFC